MTPYGLAFGWIAFLAAAATLAFLRAFYVVNIRPALRTRRSQRSNITAAS